MFLKRLLSGIVLLVIAIGSFALGGYLLAGVLLFISVIAYIELAKALAGRMERWKPNAPDILALSAIVIYYITTVINYHPIETYGILGVLVMPDMVYVLAVLAAFILAELLVYVLRYPVYTVEDIAHVIFSFCYAPLMFSFIYLIRMTGYYGYLVWVVLISSWGCDTCAYCVGMLIGRHKIFPKLSPKKSAEGCLGGILGAALLGWLFGHFYVRGFAEEPYVEWMLAAVCGLGAIAGMIGDLAASAIKRNKGIKDYGRLIPGHGGVMDRFDSVIMTGPMAFILLYLLLY